MKAIAEIEINLEKITGFVDIEINSELNEKVLFQKKINKVKAGKKERITLNLEWNLDNKANTLIGENIETIEIPVQIKVLQNI